MLMNKEQIMEIIPHRDPFLLIDEVTEMEIGKTIRAVKYVREDEYYFKGHFPAEPVMPGVLIMEALAQAAGILSFKTAGEMPNETSLFFFAGIDKARFKRQVIPGDQLHLHIEITRRMRSVWKYNAVARVDGDVAAEAELMCAKSDVA